MNMKKPIREVISWCLIAIAVLLLLECSLRLYHMFVGHPVWVSDTFRGYKHSKNNRFSYNFHGKPVPNITDENGFIGKGLAHEKKLAFRVMVLGDSLTRQFMCHGDKISVQYWKCS